MSTAHKTWGAVEDLMMGAIIRLVSKSLVLRTRQATLVASGVLCVYSAQKAQTLETKSATYCSTLTFLSASSSMSLWVDSLQKGWLTCCV